MGLTYCSFPFEKIKISARGDVSMCCYQGWSLGNLLHQEFDSIWLSDLAKEIRVTTLAGDLHQSCKGWGACPFLQKPKIKNAMVVEDFQYPIEIELDLPNTHCNIGGNNPTPDTACFMCPRASKQFVPDPDITDQIVDKIKFLMPKLKRIMVLGVSEPFWKDKVFHVLERLDFASYNEHILFHTFTNGTVFNGEKQDRFLSICKKSNLMFSLDAATPDTYKKIRRLDVFLKLIENIRHYKKKLTPGHSFFIANNINTVNVKECVKMVELASYVGADKVVFNPTHDCGGAVDLSQVMVNQDNAWSFQEAEDKIRRKGKELNMNVNFVRPLSMGMTSTSKKRIMLI